MGQIESDRYLRTHWLLADLARGALTHPGDLLFLYTDGAYAGTDEEERDSLEAVMRAACVRPSKDICQVILEQGSERDQMRRERGEDDLIDDKTVVIIKRS